MINTATSLRVSLFFILICCIGCMHNHSSSKQPFLFSMDTIDLDIRGKMRPAVRVDFSHAVKHKDKYYCFLNEYEFYSYHDERKFFCIFSDDGEIQYLEPFSEGLSRRYFDLFVKGDSIMFMDYLPPHTFYFDTEAMQWVQIDEADDAVYDDDNYLITSRDFGEWGYLTWFRNKTTGKEYELGAFTNIVNRVDGSYYITEPYRIFRVKDPTKLLPATPDRYYSVSKKKNIMHDAITYNQLQGVEAVYGSDTIEFNESLGEFSEDKLPEVNIATSFVYDNKLFHLCIDTTSMYVAKLDSGQLIAVQHIAEPHAIFDWYNSYRMKIQPDGSQLLKFQTDNPNLFGLINLKGNEIDIRYLRHNIDSVPYLGRDIFPEIFTRIRNDLDSLSLSEIYKLEQVYGATKLRRNKFGLSKERYPGGKEYNIVGSERFVHIQNEIISCISEYYYEKDDSLIRFVSMEWRETQSYKQEMEKYETWTEREAAKKKRFQSKVDELVSYLTATLQSAPVVKKEKRFHTYYDLSWTTNDNLRINMRYNNDFAGGREIGMDIYRD